MFTPRQQRFSMPFVTRSTLSSTTSITGYQHLHLGSSRYPTFDYNLNDDDDDNDDNDEEEEDEEEEEEDPYTSIAESEFNDDYKSKSSAMLRMSTSSLDWGGEIGKLRQRVDDIESGKSQDPSHALYRYFSSKSPNQMIGNFVSTANPEVIQAMSGAVQSLLGGLSNPQMGMETIVRASGEKLGNLCFQLQMTGYMFRNAEYVVALKNIMKIHDSATIQEYREAFDRLDKDQSGYIEANEIEQLLQDVYSDGNVPSFEIQSFLQYFDTNQDGKVSWEEFERGLGAVILEKNNNSLNRRKQQQSNNKQYLLSDGSSSSSSRSRLDNSYDDDDEEEEDDEFLDTIEPRISGTIEIELKNGNILEVEAEEYMNALKKEAMALKAAIVAEKGGNGPVPAGGIPGSSSSRRQMPNDDYGGITQFILERQGDLQSLTEGISPKIVESMKLLIEFVLDSGSGSGPDGTTTSSSSSSSSSSSGRKSLEEIEMEIPGSALQQLALWQLVLGYRLREAEATGEYLKLLE